MTRAPMESVLDPQRLRRLRLRSWRRGMREMDLILGPFAEGEAGGFSSDQCDEYELLLEENDQDLYAWVSGASAAPAVHAPLLAWIRAFHRLG